MPAEDLPAQQHSTLDEAAAEMSGMFQQLVHDTDAFGDRITDLWRRALPVAEVSGLNLLGTATAMTARLHALGPHGDPLEQAMMLTIAWADRAKAQLQAQVDDIEEFRTQLGLDTESPN
ncbi:hypothetical protein ACFWU5_05680 [Nocardia sp. NPDC058640]|uniref:hypothetical protein n=1 Tax=Nocardia sp. NPDC058640 TaxID=3346571 RepID=UPI00365627DA